MDYTILTTTDLVGAETAGNFDHSIIILGVCAAGSSGTSTRHVYHGTYLVLEYCNTRVLEYVHVYVLGVRTRVLVLAST